METKELIKHCLKDLTGQEFEIELIEGRTVVIHKKGYWELFITPKGELRLIGAFFADDLDIVNQIKEHSYMIKELLETYEQTI